MPRIQLDLDPSFLIFVVEVHLENIPAVRDRLAKQGKPIPPRRKLRALVDTGASHCSTSRDIIKALHLYSPSAQSFEVTTGGGTVRSQRYKGSISLAAAPTIAVESATIHETTIGPEMPFEFVLGMSALGRWGFSYNPISQKLTLEG